MLITLLNIKVRGSKGRSSDRHFLNYFQGSRWCCDRKGLPSGENQIIDGIIHSIYRNSVKDGKHLKLLLKYFIHWENLQWNWKIRRTPKWEITSDISLSVRNYFSIRRGWMRISFEWINSVLFPRHTNKKARANTIDLIHTFRDYLHYHIKCSKVGISLKSICPSLLLLKVYMHTRMRSKTSDFLKVLNRARPEVKVEKKTITWVPSYSLSRWYRKEGIRQVCNIYQWWHFSGRSFNAQ